MRDAETSSVVVRHFRQTVLWPLLLVPEKETGKLQRHWEALGSIERGNAWREVIEEFQCDPKDFLERSYREFVTFLPFVQRFLYGSKVGIDPARREGEASLRIYRRSDIRKVVIRYSDGSALTFNVGHVDLYFFLDADIMLLAFEIYIDDIPLDRAQDTMFRFGRAYPGFWDEHGRGRKLSATRRMARRAGCRSCGVRLRRAAPLSRARRAPSNRAARGALAILARAVAAGRLTTQIGSLRFRPLEYYRMPFLAYLAVDDPKALSRADFVRLALATQPGERDVPPYSEHSVATFEKDYCEDRYWSRPRKAASATRGSWSPGACSGWSGGTAIRSSTAPRRACWASSGINIFCCS